MVDFHAKIRELQQRIEKLPYALEFPREGCTDEDIRVLEEYAESPLPQAYLEFLRIFGRQKGRFFKGMSGSLEDRYGLRMRELANGVLERTGSNYRVPEKSFVFTELQGYAFWFFPLGDSDDPPVYTIGEGEFEPALLSPSFTAFLTRCIEELEELAGRRPAAFGPPQKSSS